MHVPHRIEIVRPCGPDLDRGAVGQQSVGTRPGLCVHVAPRLCRRLTMPHLTRIMSYPRTRPTGDSACVSLPPGGQQLAHGHEDVPGVGHGPDQTVELLHEGGVRLGAAVVREHDAAGGVPPQYLVDVDTRASAPRARLLHDHVPRRARSQATNRVMAETARFTDVRHGPTTRGGVPPALQQYVVPLRDASTDSRIADLGLQVRVESERDCAASAADLDE